MVNNSFYVFFMRVISSLILTWNSYMLCAQPSNVDIMFEGYENSRLYDRWEYVLYRKHQSPAYKKVTLPPSVFLKLWDKDKGSTPESVDNNNVSLYWIGPREFTEESRILWKKMAKKWGIRSLSLYIRDDRTDSVVNFVLDAIPAKWMYNDTLVASRDVKHYGESWVAEPSSTLILAPDNGTMRETSGNALVKERSRLLSDCDMILNTTHLKHTSLRMIPKVMDVPKQDTQTLNLYARDITRFLPENTPKDVKREYHITLFIDSLGCSHLFQYQDFVKDSVDNILLSGLEASIKANNYDTFRRLLTMEGEIFPWKYIRASYIHGKWYFMDEIWTEEETAKYYKLRNNLNSRIKTCIELNKILNDEE